jgi:LSD1 subclass zinc finger protein
MPEALKCPSCSAPLDYPPGGGANMRCPYCDTTVMIPGYSMGGAKSTGAFEISM